MSYVASQLWMFLLSIFVVGVLTAILVRQPEERRWMAAWLKWAVLASAAAVAVVMVGAVSGRAGFFVESGLLGFAAYLIGGFVGTRLTRGSWREHKGWALGLVPAIMIWLAGNALMTPRIEDDLKQRVGQAMESAGADLSKLEISGRDVILPDELANRASLVDAIQDVNGVRLVVSAEKLKEALTARREPLPVERKAVAPIEQNASDKTATQQEEPAPPVAALQPPVVAPKPPVEPQVAAPSAQVAAPPPATAPPAPVPQPQKEAPQSPPTQLSVHEPIVAEIGPPPPESKMPMEKTNVVEPMIKVPAVGALGAAACQSALSATAAKDKVQFGAGNAKIRFASTPFLDKVAELLKRCPGTRFEIGAKKDAAGESAPLTQRRLERLVDYLEREGIEHGRLIADQAKKPRSQGGEAGAGDARRVEFQME